jgi:secondary thiamine-phosphate synthase enzyme
MLQSLAEGPLSGGLIVGGEPITLRSRSRLEFIDITDAVTEAVGRCGVGRGLVHVQSRHTTTGVVVNENEPLLLEDFRRLLEEWAPRRAAYRHNDLGARESVPPGERPNADAHARALLLGHSETLEVAEGRLQLGRWQRLFLVELDGPRLRTVSVLVLGRAPGEAGIGPRIASLHARVKP